MASSGLEISSNSESAADMLETLGSPKNDRTPRILVDRGKAVDKDDDEASKAASVLGKKGGQAAAAKRAEEAKAKDAPADVKAKAGKDGDAEGDLDKAVKDSKDAKAAKDKTAGEDEGDEPEADATGKPRDDPKARIRQLAEQKNAERARADKAERELAEARRTRTTAPEAERRPAPVAAPARVQAPADDPKPTLEQFAGKPYEDYSEAVSRWAARDEHRQVRAREDVQRQHEERDRDIKDTMKSFFTRMEEHEKSEEGFSERTGQPLALFNDLPLFTVLQPSFTLPRDPATGKLKGLTGYNVVADYLLRSDLAPKIADHFVSAPETLQRIATLRTPSEIREAMAELKGQLSGPSKDDRSDAVIADTSSGREVSKAGSPVRSVAGSPHAAAPDIVGDMEFDTFMSRKRARKS